MKGEISVPVAALLGIVAFAVGTAGTFYSAQIATADRFSKDEIDIATTKRDVEHVNEQLDRVEMKLDALLEKQNINPNKFFTPTGELMSVPVTTASQ